MCIPNSKKKHFLEIHFLITAVLNWERLTFPNVRHVILRTFIIYYVSALVKYIFNEVRK